jgi:hypothetical protein
MYLVTVRATSGRLLFRTWEEARELWWILVRIPGIVAVVLMPDHIHLILREAGLERVSGALRAWALRRNHRRGETGAVWEQGWAPRKIQDRRHTARLLRYAHLNPCRAGLVKDPLSWPFSTHRDMVRLAWPPARAPSEDAAGFHRYVSQDATVRPEGTDLPPPIGAEGISAHGAIAIPASGRRSRAPTAAEMGGRVFPLAVVEQAVSAVTRTPARILRSCGPERTLLLRAARLFTGKIASHIAEELTVNVSTVIRADPRIDEPIRIVQRVIGDPRFQRLNEGHLRELGTWRAYRSRD